MVNMIIVIKIVIEIVGIKRNVRNRKKYWTQQDFKIRYKYIYNAK